MRKQKVLDAISFESFDKSQLRKCKDKGKYRRACKIIRDVLGDLHYEVFVGCLGKCDRKRLRLKKQFLLPPHCSALPLS